MLSAQMLFIANKQDYPCTFTGERSHTIELFSSNGSSYTSHRPAIAIKSPLEPTEGSQQQPALAAKLETYKLRKTQILHQKKLYVELMAEVIV